MVGPFDLSGRAALVTGASSGLGRHFAIVLARAGAKVALAARRSEALTALAREIESFDGRAVPVRMDVTDKASVSAAIEAAETELGAVHILVNNAGIAVMRPLLEQTEDDWDRVIDTNLKGAFLVAQEVARHMVRLGHGGSIVNVASILGIGALAQLAGYAAAKAGLIQLTKAMAIELARYDIRVNALIPGYVETDLNRDFFASPEGERLVKRIPQRRLARPEDLDGPLLLLASDASRHMTAGAIVVDGGHSASL